MPSNVIDSPRDEKLWERAVEQAKKQDKGENYAYIMAIYKNMKPDHEFKTAARFNPSPDEEWILRQVAKAARTLYPDIIKNAEGARVILDSYAKWQSHTIAATAYAAWQREQWRPVTSSLRSSLIRLAAARPDLRPHLLPLLKRAAIETYTVSLYNSDDAAVDRDNDRDLQNKLDRYNLVNRSVHGEGVDYTVEVDSRRYPVFLGDMAEYKHFIRPADLKLFRGSHGQQIKLADSPTKFMWDPGEKVDNGWRPGHLAPGGQADDMGSDVPPAQKDREEEAKRKIGALRGNPIDLNDEVKQFISNFRSSVQMLRLQVVFALEKNDFEPVDVNIHTERGRVSFSGKIKDKAEMYRTREQVEADFDLMFGVGGQLSGHSGEWSFQMGEWYGL